MIDDIDTYTPVQTYNVCCLQCSVTGLEEVPEPREIYSGEGKLKINDSDTYTPVQTCNV